MRKSVPSAKQFEEAAFACAAALVAFLVCAIIDGVDGVTSMRSQTYRFLDDPVGFRAVLIVRWGFPAILAVAGAIALGIGALVVKGSEKASTDQ